MKILIIGAGAIGGSMAAMLASAGENVTLLEKNKQVYSLISTNGLTLKNGDKVISVSPKVINSISDTDEKFDCCFVATRCYHLKRAVCNALCALVEDAPVISLTNGVCIDQLASLIGNDRALACSINYGVGITSPGNYYMKIKGGLVIGSKSGQVNRQLIRIAKMLNNVTHCTVTENITGTLYSKMLINSCITSTAVISGLTLGEILTKDSGKAIFDGIIREGIAVADRAGIKVPPYNGKLNYYRVISPSLFGRATRAVAYKHFVKKYGFRTSATLEALRNGTPTETAYFNGYIADLGEKFGVPTPLNSAITALIAEIEHNLGLISPINLNDLAKIASTVKD